MSSRPALAKLTRPRLRDVEARPRLFQRLDELRHESPALWIGAPAGSGKTALVVSYIEDRELPVLWYRIDERDQHVAELFFYLRVAAEAMEGDPSGSLELPVFSQGVELARFARRFFEALFLRLPSGGLVVFDDYHTASVGSEWQAAFEKCLAGIPPGLNVVVLSRQAPPGSLARSIVHRELGVLESSELLLSEQETAALARRRLGKKQKLSAQEVAQIHAATSGWAAGVSLLLRSNQGGNLAALSGRRAEPLFDYLTNAVFSELSEATQALLLHSACLRRFSVIELEALAGLQVDPSELLGLYRSGFFLESDGPGEQVFRCHPLFRSFLSYRAEQLLGAEALRSARARAADMLQKDGRGEEAVELLALIGDQLALCELVASLAPSLFAQGRSAMLGEWLSAIASENVEASGWLSYWQANCLLATEPSFSLNVFERALAIFEREQDSTGAYLAWAGAVQALVYEQRNFQLLDRWLVRLTDLESFSPGFASAEVGAAVVSSLLLGLTFMGAERSAFERWTARAMALADKASDPSVRAMAASVLVLNFALRGESSAAATWLAALERYSANGPTLLIGQVAARAAATTLAWHEGHNAAAVAVAEEGLALLGQNRVPMWQLALLIYGSLAALNRGASEAGDRFLARLTELASSSTPLELAGYHHVRACRALVRGENKQALSCIELGIDLDRAVGFHQALGVDLQIAAHLHFELGDEASGRAALRESRRIEETHRHPALRYWRLLIEADRALQLGERDPASALLREAFSAGREQQIFNMFCPRPARVAELCQFALAQDIEAEYVCTLVRRNELFQHAAPVGLLTWPWPIRIRTFGGIEVRLDDKPLALGRVRTPLLLLRLLLTTASNRTGMPVARVLASLWPDSDGDNAEHAFDMTVLRLRGQLGEQGRKALRIERGHVLLDSTLCWTDTMALSELLSEIDASGPELSLERCTALAARLEQLYRGPFADEDEIACPFGDYGERVRRKVSAALRTLNTQFSRLGDARPGKALSLRLCEVDPLLRIE